MSDWRDRAACLGIDPDVMVPDRGSPTAPAKAVCARCPVAGPCLDEALADPWLLGVWGGTSFDERRQLRKRLRICA